MAEEKLEAGVVEGEEVYEVSRSSETNWKITIGGKTYKGDPDKVIEIRNKFWKDRAKKNNTKTG